MKVLYAENEFFNILINQYKGIANLAAKLNVNYCEINNWKHRGYVSRKRVTEVSEKLGVPPCLLNNKQFHYICDWTNLLNKVPFLSSLDIKHLKSLPLKYS